MERDSYSDILQAITKIHDKLKFTVTLVGPERELDITKGCVDLIKAYSLNWTVRVVGPKWGKDKIQLFRKSSIFLLPSYTENFPLVIIEAACAGLPIITTPVGAIPEFFEHDKSVIFVKPGNINQIEHAIIELLTKEDKRRRLGEAARKVFVSRLSRDKIMKSLNSVYRTVLSADCS